MKEMPYNPIARDSKLRDEILADPVAREIYEETKLQIDLVMKLKKQKIDNDNRYS